MGHPPGYSVLIIHSYPPFSGEKKQLAVLRYLCRLSAFAAAGSHMTQKKKETGEKTAKRVAVGTAYGMLGMVSFSVTLPATRAAVLYFHPSVVALVRPVVAAAFTAVLLITTKSRFPPRQHWKSFVLIVLGVVIGVPITFAWGMHSLPAAHGAITLALLPLTTALFAKLRTGEHPSKRFWGASLAGSASVVAFAVAHAAGAMRMGDAVLFLSVIASSLGYAEGARR